MKKIILILGLFFLVYFLTACSRKVEPETYMHEPASIEVASPEAQSPPVMDVHALDKWSLWMGGTQLRGANIWQRIVVSKYDGNEFLGDGYIGPPYTQADFDSLAALGANYVNLSHPGIFTERPPYVLDEKVLANLDKMILMSGRIFLKASMT